MSETVQIALKLPAELILRIDAAAGAGKRSGFIRGAIEAALSPDPVLPVTDATLKVLRSAKAEAAKVISLKPAGGFTANAQRVLDLASKYPHSERDLIRVLGWPPGDVKGAIVELEAAGKLRWSRGMVEAI